MKVPAKIPVRRFICCPGKIEAEGRKASPSFCYRLKTSGTKDQKTVIELHSKVTGRKIGYIGKSIKKPFSATRSAAQEWGKLPGYTPRQIPITVAQKMQQFIKFAQDPDSGPKVAPQYRDIAMKAWKTILREARKT